MVISEAAEVLRVPTDALVRNGRAWAVFLAERGRSRLTAVSVGEGGQDFRQVEAGLREGQSVVLFPGDDLKDGARVRAAKR